jgi:transcription elongation factor SPT5
VEEKYIVMFSDLTLHEVKILPKDCQICSDMATGVDALGQFQLGDLVILDAATVGVIVRLEKEYFQVLNMHGKLAHVRHQAVTKKRDTRRAVALDSEQNQLNVEDHVKVTDGPHSGRQGQIKHLYRGYAFVHSRMYTENGGIFVCKTRNLKLAGGITRTTVDSSAVGIPYMSPRVMPSPRNTGGGGFNAGNPMNNRGGRDKADLEMIGKTIKINRGPYKGYIGIVKDSIGATARVELHASCQTITVDKTRVEIVGGQQGARVGNLSTYARTPMYGSQTPMSGSRTPMYSDGSRTPMHDGSRTPMYEGNRTPRGAGSQTPSYDPSRTPVHSSSAWDPSAAATPRADFDDYGAEPSPSPGYHHNPPTPGYLNPETPQGGPYTPQTPGMYASYSQASPAGMQAPSPAGNFMGTSPAGYGYSPMTPGAGGATSPMGYNPHTPGAGMDHMMSNAEWQTIDIEVRIKSGDDPDLIGQTGIIRGITSNMCSLFLRKEDRTVNIQADFLEPVQPSPGDHVKVIFGDMNREATGKLLSVDEKEGVVNLDGVHGGPKLINMAFLCKAKPN